MTDKIGELSEVKALMDCLITINNTIRTLEWAQEVISNRFGDTTERDILNMLDYTKDDLELCTDKVKVCFEQMS